jgi:SAM-dependent methyltransferase
MRCLACDGNANRLSLAQPVDYEYAVVPPQTFCYLRCASCASEWLSPRPEESKLPQFYPSAYHAHNDDHGLVAKLLVWVRSQMRGRAYRALLPDGTRGALFDVGTGDCRHFIELGKFANWQFAGVEIQSAVAEKARELGFDVETGTLEQMDIGRHVGLYDVVSMNHVLEHVINPEEVIERCWKLLRPGGWLIGQLPTNSSWEAGMGKVWAGYHYPRNLQVFSRKGLRELLHKKSFREITISSAPHCQTAISLQNLLLALGVPLQLRHGRSGIYGVLLVASLPFEVVAWIFNRSGTIDFKARK